MQEIPPPTSQPSLEALPVKEHESQDEVIFDIEATGLGNCTLIFTFSKQTLIRDIVWMQVMPINMRARSVAFLK